MGDAEIRLSFGDVRTKSIVTPNHFISHMIEHIAWRMGLQIRLCWPNSDWKALGQALGAEIRKFPKKGTEAAALGMIDDGSATVAVRLGQSGAAVRTLGGIDLRWFLALRVEQVATGEPLVQLLEGLSEGLQAGISVEVWNLEDPHHTWEGVYRGLGVALGRIFAPEDLTNDAVTELACNAQIERQQSMAEVSVLERGVNRATVRRGTAETGITVTADFTSSSPNNIELEIDDSIRAATEGIEELLSILSDTLGVSLQIQFRATNLSSSHVVMEDIGLVLGRTLLEILKLRMEQIGVNGAGSNIHIPTDVVDKSVQVGISVEGRKFWRLVPANGNFSEMQKKLVIGQRVLAGLRSEDLDDLLDGLSGGMSASIMVHIHDYGKPESTWLEMFRCLGLALHEAFHPNPYRRGVPPGVKATLA